MKTVLLAAAIGAGVGVAMIALGFNFHMGRTLWIGGSATYLPSAIAGAAVGAVIAYTWRRRWRA